MNQRNKSNFYSTHNDGKRTNSIRKYIIYDYETYGTDKHTAIAQLGAVKLDPGFNIVDGTQINIVVRPIGDRVMSLGASEVTKMNMQHLFDKGSISETELAYNFYEYLTADNGTCILGYNNIGFDDKVTEHLFYRNFGSVYDYRYKNFNSRADLFPITIAFSTLCPNVLQWPRDEQGGFSFKLENLAKANNLQQNQAHDAYSDVIACVDLLRRYGSATPVLQIGPEYTRVNTTPLECFNYLIEFRNKKVVNDYLTNIGANCFVYFSMRNSKTLRGATPVVSLFNTKSVENPKDSHILVDLSLEHSTFKVFFDLTDEQHQKFASLKNYERKFANPFIVVKNNSFPLFATVNECRQNTELMALLDNVKANYEFFSGLSSDNVKRIAGFYDRFAETANGTAQINLNNVDLPEEFISPIPEHITARSQRPRQKLVALDNDPYKDIKWPESSLNSNVGQLFNYWAGIFDFSKGPNPVRFQEFIGQISSSPDLNRMFTLYLGNNYYDQLTQEHKIEYARMMLSRLHSSYEDFYNEVVNRKADLQKEGLSISEYDKKLQEITEIEQIATGYYKYCCGVFSDIIAKNTIPPTV